jgi:hypothetical protein
MLALAATDASAEPGQIFFDCDATPGHFSRMEVMLPPQKERLTGSLKAEMLYREGEWMPAAQLRLSEADGENWIGIKLVADVPARKVVRDGATADVVIMRKATAPRSPSAAAARALPRAPPVRPPRPCRPDRRNAWRSSSPIASADMRTA